MASCSKCNRQAAWRFEEQLLSFQPDATPLLAIVFRASSSFVLLQRAVARASWQRSAFECLRHTTRDETQLQARQASSKGVGPKRQRLKVRAHAAAEPTLLDYHQLHSRHLINLCEHEDPG